MTRHYPREWRRGGGNHEHYGIRRLIILVRTRFSPPIAKPERGPRETSILKRSCCRLKSGVWLGALSKMLSSFLHLDKSPIYPPQAKRGASGPPSEWTTYRTTQTQKHKGRERRPRPSPRNPIAPAPTIGPRFLQPSAASFHRSVRGASTRPLIPEGWLYRGQNPEDTPAEASARRERVQIQRRIVSHVGMSVILFHLLAQLPVFVLFQLAIWCAKLARTLPIYTVA
jgi:hypothetical protein